MSRKKKNSELNTYANQATAAGLTYGQYQAAEYKKYTEVGSVPKGYRKAGDKKS